jgi:hypothetical protein
MMNWILLLGLPGNGLGIDVAGGDSVVGFAVLAVHAPVLTVGVASASVAAAVVGTR